MRLVVIGGFSLDILQKEVVKSFSGVPKKGLETSWDTIPESPFKESGMPFTDACLEKVFYIAPVKDRHGLSVSWQIPSQLNNWKSKPGDYIAHLIGHEAQGSLLAALKSRSWATACCAGVGGEGYEVRSLQWDRHFVLENHATDTRLHQERVFARFVYYVLYPIRRGRCELA